MRVKHGAHHSGTETKATQISRTHLGPRFWFFLVFSYPFRGVNLCNRNRRHPVVVSTNRCSQQRCSSGCEARQHLLRSETRNQDLWLKGRRITFDKTWWKKKDAGMHSPTFKKRKKTCSRPLKICNQLVVLSYANPILPLPWDKPLTTGRYSWGSLSTSSTTSLTCSWGKLLPLDPLVVATVPVLCAAHLPPPVFRGWGEDRLGFGFQILIFEGIR